MYGVRLHGLWSLGVTGRSALLQGPMEMREMAMPDQAGPRWTIRSTLISVADLERSVSFYREIGPFEELTRADAVAVLGESSLPSVALILRESRSTHRVRHGQQSLGLRSITFDVGTPAELDRVETLLRKRGLFTTRQTIVDAASDLVVGRDPDNLPLVFVCYADGVTLSSDYYGTIAEIVYSLDV
jgi:hypothetical protein